MLLLALTAVALCGCDKPDKSTATAPAGTLRIAVIPKATNHEYWKAIHAGAIKAERELEGVQIIWKGPPREDDRDGQIGTVENFVNTGVSGIVLSPLDDTALLAPVEHAMMSHIPVVIMDSSLKATAGVDYVSYVATDNEDGGRKAARRMAELVGDTGRIIVLRYQVGSGSTSQREQGFLSEIKTKFPKIQILSEDQYAGATTEAAFAKAENLLSKYPEVQGIFAACEPVVFGILRALDGAGKTGSIKLVGFDRSEKLVEAMKQGHIHGLVLQDPMKIGYLGVKTVVTHLRGETVPGRIDTGSILATRENMNEPAVAELLAPPVEKYLP